MAPMSKEDEKHSDTEEESHTNKDSQVSKSVPKKRQPICTKQIHVPGFRNAFTYEMYGKRKIDQTLQRFCIKNKCIGVFEVKLELKKFGLRPNQIGSVIYDADENGITVKYNSKTHGFDMTIPFPSSITVYIPRNPEAIYLGPKIGILSCRIPIIKHELELRHYNAHKQPKLGAVGGKKKRKWNSKIDKRLQRNHAKLGQIKINNALENDFDNQLTGFQKSLYNKETDRTA
eukprot:901232_1